MSALFGVAGFPPNFFASKFRKDRVNGPEWVASIGLDLLELQMTYGPKMKPESAVVIGEKALEHQIRLTIHGSYFIVFTSDDIESVNRSHQTLKSTCELALLAGVNRIILHPGSAYDSRQRSLDTFIRNLTKFVENDLPDGVTIYPETSGKRGQIGSLEEILIICKEVPRTAPCIDFGHLRAHNRGGWSDSKAIKSTFDLIKERLGIDRLLETHVHITPIEFNSGGEVRHRAYGEHLAISSQENFLDTCSESQPYLPDPTDLAKVLKNGSLPLWVISECFDSQDIGALAMKQTYLNEL